MKKLLSNGAINTISLALPKLILLILYTHLSSELEINKFTELSTIISVVLTFQMFTNSGFSKASNRYYTLFRGDSKNRSQYLFSILITNVFFSFIFSIIFFLGSDWYFNGYFSFEISKANVLLATASVFLSSVVGFSKGVIYALTRIKFLFIATLASACTMLLYMFFSKGRENALLELYFTGVLVECVLLYAFVFHRGLSVKLHSNWKIYKTIFSFSIPTIISSLLVTPVNMVLMAFISSSGSNHDVSLYNVLVQWRNIVVFVPNAFSVLALTSMTKSAENSKNMLDDFKKHFYLISGIGFFVAFWLCVFSEHVTHLYPSFDIDIFQYGFVLSAIVGVLISVNSIVGQAISAKGKTIEGLILNSIWALVLLSTSYIFLNTLHEIEIVFIVLISTIISYIIHTILQFYFVIYRGQFNL